MRLVLFSAASSIWTLAAMCAPASWVSAAAAVPLGLHRRDFDGKRPSLSSTATGSGAPSNFPATKATPYEKCIMDWPRHNDQYEDRYGIGDGYHAYEQQCAEGTNTPLHSRYRDEIEAYNAQLIRHVPKNTLPNDIIENKRFWSRPLELAAETVNKAGWLVVTVSQALRRLWGPESQI